ncbi:hypothetical protein TWF730_007206 [Orbilia blumenaviensis]|uniref:F-box domain-containing protein n=1 Tax=Orbilia blumenaviensis TaxID=1796055 RepID=A0AAV9V7S9_9PEZI
MDRRTDILGRLPREIGYEIASQFGVREYIGFCQVSKTWASLLRNDSLASDMTRKHFGSSQDLADYKDAESRFSVLRNLVFRDHARRNGLVMKTKRLRFRNGSVRAKNIHSGVLAIEALKSGGPAPDVYYALDLDRKAKSPLRAIIDLRGRAANKDWVCYAGPGFIVQIDKGSESEVKVSNYFGEVVANWYMKVPGAYKMKYIYGCTDRYVVIRMQDFKGELVHYEIWDATTKGVMTYDIDEDILSSQSVLARGSEDEDGFPTLIYYDWREWEWNLRIQNDTKIISLSNRFDGNEFLIQRLSFASPEKLVHISQTQTPIVLPQFQDEYGISLRQIFVTRWRGVMTTTNDIDDPKNLHVHYFWHDGTQSQESGEGVRQQIWKISDTENLSVINTEQAYFPMGETLYGIMALTPDAGSKKLRRLRENGCDWVPDGVDLGIPLSTYVEVFCDGRHAVTSWIARMKAVPTPTALGPFEMLVLEWHDFDSWWASQEGSQGQGLEVEYEFRKDGENSLANFGITEYSSN